jgi:ADP-ribosyltransferase exoenzyme
MLQEVKKAAAFKTHQCLLQNILEEIKTKSYKKVFQVIAQEAASMASAHWNIEDIQAIHNYTGAGYIQLNNALRNNSVTQDIQDRIDAVAKAMGKVSKFNRRVCIAEWTYQTIKAGEEFMDCVFVSTLQLKNCAF